MAQPTRHVSCLRDPNLLAVYFNRSDAFKTIENLPARLSGPGNELILADVSYSIDRSTATSHQTGIAYDLLADSVPDDLGGFRLLRVLRSGRIEEGNSYHELKCKYTENKKNGAQHAKNTMVKIIMQYEIRMGKVSFSPAEQQLPPSQVPPPPVTPQPNRRSPSPTANANDNEKLKLMNDGISGLNDGITGLLQVCSKQEGEIRGLKESCSKQNETTTMLVGCVKHLNENLQEVDKKHDGANAKVNARVDVLETQLGDKVNARVAVLETQLGDKVDARVAVLVGDLVSKLNLGGEDGREKPMDVDGDENDGEIPPPSSIPPLPPHPSFTAINTTPRTQHHPTTTPSSNFAQTPGSFTSNMGTSMAPNNAGTSTFQFQSPIRNHTTPAAAAAGGGGGVAAKTTFTAPPPTSTLRGTPTATATATAAPPAANRSFSIGTWESKPKNNPRGILTPQQMTQKQSERISARKKLLRKGTKKGKGPESERISARKKDNPILRTQKQRKLSDKRMNAPSTGTPLKGSGSTTATPELPFNIQF